MKIYSLKQVAVLLLLAGFAAACENIENKEDATPVVRVGEEVLTTNDLKKVLPDDVNHEDSAA